MAVPRKSAFFAIFLVLSVNAEERDLQIVSSIPPLNSLARSIAQNQGTCEAILDRTMDHHLVELKPSDVLKLSKADIILLNGLGLEAWARSIPLDLSSKTIELFESSPKTKSNPHAWLSISMVLENIPRLRDALCAKKPKSCAEFQKNSEKTLHDISSVRERLRVRAANLSNKEFLSDHPTWTLFAADIGLSQAATLRHSGHEDTLTIKDMARFSSKAKLLQKRVFTIEPSTNLESIKSLIRDLSLNVVELDPLGTGAEDYGVFIERNGDKLLSALEK